jgi:hypothetical protein
MLSPLIEHDLPGVEVPDSGEVWTSWLVELARDNFHPVPLVVEGPMVADTAEVPCDDRLIEAISSRSSSWRTFCNSVFFSSSRILDYRK